MAWTRTWLALAVLAGVAALGCSGAASGGPALATPVATLSRSDDGLGGVAVEAVWVSAEHLVEMGDTVPRAFSTGNYVLLHLKLDTHSVNLVGYDLPRLAALEDTAGRSIAAAEWVSIKEDSHHREGLLAFPGESNEAWAVRQREAHLRLHDIAGVPERTFRWQF